MMKTYHKIFHTKSLLLSLVLCMFSNTTLGLEQLWGGLKGYISADIDAAVQGYGYGVSYYVSVWPLLSKPLFNFQVGLPSTWIIPNNNDFEPALCPPHTM